jgi:LuxR family transcriptional activator of conjugal transfer of Ti plasmids
MDRDVTEFVRGLDVLKTAHGTWATAVAFMRSHGINHAAYAFGPRPRASDTVPNIIFFDTYPGWFNNRYISLGWAGRDPLLGHCLKTLVPWVVDTEQFACSDDPETSQLLREMRVCGARCGIVFPLSGGGRYPVAGISMFSSLPAIKFDRLLASHGHSFQTAAAYAHMRIQTLLAQEVTAGSHLTPRQQECLRLVAVGLTSKEIAERLGISYRVVQEHVSFAIRRLGARNCAAAVDRARVLGLLDG